MNYKNHWCRIMIIHHGKYDYISLTASCWHHRGKVSPGKIRDTSKKHFFSLSQTLKRNCELCRAHKSDTTPCGSDQSTWSVTLQSCRYRSWHHQSLWLTQRVTLWSSTAVSRWRIMSQPSVGPATFNCASCVLSPDLSQPTQQRRLCMLSLHVDSTTATPCCTVLPTHYSCGCRPYRTLLLTWLRVHGDGITSLRFWGTSIGYRFGAVSTTS